MYTQDTIVAISTALGEGAIGLVRLSGPEAIAIADQLFPEKDLSQVASHTIHYGHIQDPRSGQILDEVMTSVMKAPRSYTTEDVVEINGHGGIVAIQSILNACLAQGARLAEAGEFTQRAFLNGRIDLSQAEAIMDLISAKTSRAKDAAMSQLQGSLKHKIRQLRDTMLNTLAQVEVTIDYPEYDDVEELSLQQLASTAELVQSEVRSILRQATQGKLFREGIKTAIIGRPNVGKSSLLNYLIGEDKAIVTDIAGTTRDTIEEYISIKGVPLHIIDTAGIRHTDEVVEQIGVEKSRAMIESADLILLILNQAQALDPMDLELLELTQNKARIILLNKQDLPNQWTIEDLASYLQDDSDIIKTSVLTEDGLTALEDAISARFLSGNLQSTDLNYLLNSRHTHLLNQALASLDEVIQSCAMSLPVDLIQIDYTRAWDALGEITGDSVQDELLTKLFSQFCLGK